MTGFKRAFCETTMLLAALTLARPTAAAPTPHSDPEHEVSPQILEQKMQQARDGKVDQVFASFLAVQTQLKMGARQYDAAVRTAEPLVQYSEIIYGPNDTKTAAALETLADVYCNLDRCGEGIPLIERASTIYRAGGPAEQPAFVRTLNSLGAAWLREGKPDRAESTLKQSLEVSQARFGSESREVGVVCLLLSAAYSAEGKTAEASANRERGRRLIAGR